MFQAIVLQDSMHLLGQHHLIFLKSCSDQLQELKQHELIILSTLAIQYQNCHRLQLLFLSHHHLQSRNELLFPSGPPFNLWNVCQPCLLMLLHVRLGLGRIRLSNQEISVRYNFAILRIQHHL